MKTTKTLTKNVMATLLLASTFVASNVFAQECLEEGVPTKPDEDFVILDEDQILDTTSDLVWRRCSEGQTWSVDSCVGEADKFSWQQALVQAHEASDTDLSGWRLPNVKELASLTERNCVRPAINTVLFPNTPADDFWSSTPSVTDPDRAWVVAFFNASHSIKEKDRFIYVRLVRTYTNE